MGNIKQVHDLSQHNLIKKYYQIIGHTMEENSQTHTGRKLMKNEVLEHAK